MFHWAIPKFAMATVFMLPLVVYVNPQCEKNTFNLASKLNDTLGHTLVTVNSIA